MIVGMTEMFLISSLQCFFLRCSTSSLSGHGLLFLECTYNCGCKIEQLGIFEDSEIGDHLTPL